MLEMLRAADLEQFLLNREGHPAGFLRAFHLQFSQHSSPPFDRLQPRLQGRDQSALFQRGRAQLKDEQPHLAQRFLRRVPQFAQVIGRVGVLSGGQQSSGGFGIERHAVQ
jgi:hypothetical protein